MMLRRWTSPGVVALAAIAAAVLGGSPIVVVLLTIVALLISPLAFPRPLTNAEAQRRSAQDGRPIVYWRPGCPFCMRLRATLTGRKAHWVDIWRDPSAAAEVRAVADGNETVPTVILAGVPHVNPDPLWLRRELRAA